MPSHQHASRTLAATPLLCLVLLAPCVAMADSDEAVAPSRGPVGMQPLSGVIAVATPYPGESRAVLRSDGSWQAVPAISGHTKLFHIVARATPWSIKPGLTVMAKTYNGVVPGPTLVVDQHDRVVIEYRNELDIPDTIHLHGIHGIPVDMDGVPGSSQVMVPPHGTYRYTFIADQAGTFIYHTHDPKAVLNAGLYGGIIVKPAHRSAEEQATRDDLEIISSWYINSNSESEFTLNGKAYPATRPLEVRRGDRLRIRWINISAENFHTMHTHGHYQRIIARDAVPLPTPEVQDTVEIGPGQRVDVIVEANQRPGTWMVHCHVLDHTEDAQGMPDGLITSIHYIGTPDKTVAMHDEMMRAMPMTTVASRSGPSPARAPFLQTILLGAFAGLTIFLGLPIARARRLRPAQINVLNAFAIGILVYLVIEIAAGAVGPVARAVSAWRTSAGPFPVGLSSALTLGLLFGLGGLAAASRSLVHHGARHVSERPMVLAMMIAVGIGAHNFAEGLAIGASAATGATAVAAGLIVGFGLHNATEGFGVAAPLAGRLVPTWGQLGLAGLIAGGPTFFGTVMGYQLSSPVLSVFFLSVAIGALVFVIGELWSVLKKTGVTMAASAMVTAGFALAFVSELMIDLNGG